MIGFSKKICRGLIILFIFKTLGGCGVKSTPSHPKGFRYPGIYPAKTQESKENYSVGNKNKGRVFRRNLDSFFQYPNQTPKK